MRRTKSTGAKAACQVLLSYMDQGKRCELNWPFVSQSMLLYLLSSELLQVSLCPCGQCLQRESSTFIGHRKGSRKGPLVAQLSPTPLEVTAVWIPASSMGSGPPIRVTPSGLSERLLTLLNQGKHASRQVRKSCPLSQP